MPPQNTAIQIEDSRGRKFAAHACAVLVIIVNEAGQVLLLKHPNREGWEVVNGALDADETVLEGVLRETCEEAGDDIQVEPLGTVHAYSFRYDGRVTHMITINYLLAYKGGEIRPGSDMSGSSYCWADMADIESGKIKILAPRDHPWVLKRAVQLYHLWKNEDRPQLQALLDPNRKNKYGY